MTVKYSDIVGVADEGSVSAEPDAVTGITLVRFRTAGVRFTVQYDALNEGIYGLCADTRRDNDWLRALKLMRKGAEQEAPGGAEVIEMTTGQYGSDVYKNFFSENNNNEGLQS